MLMKKTTVIFVVLAIVFAGTYIGVRIFFTEPQKINLTAHSSTTTIDQGQNLTFNITSDSTYGLLSDYSVNEIGYEGVVLSYLGATEPSTSNSNTPGGVNSLIPNLEGYAYFKVSNKQPKTVATWNGTVYSNVGQKSHFTTAPGGYYNISIRFASIYQPGIIKVIGPTILHVNGVYSNASYLPGNATTVLSMKDTSVINIHFNATIKSFMTSTLVYSTSFNSTTPFTKYYAVNISNSEPVYTILEVSFGRFTLIYRLDIAIE